MKRKCSLKKKESWTGLLFIFPQLIAFLFVCMLPIILCFYYSITDRNGIIIGLLNYQELWASKTFLLAVKNTLYFGVIGVVFLIIISFILANLFHHIILLTAYNIKWLQSILILPMVMPSITAILFFRIIFDRGGVLNQWLDSSALYIHQEPYAFWILIFIYLWKNCGYCSVLMISALIGIDREQYEAARCDGASTIRQILHITLPQIKSSLLFSIIIAIIDVFKIFRESYLLMGEYPHESVYMLQNFILNNMETLNYPRLSAATLTFAALLSAIIIIFVYVSKVLDEGDEV